jgi:2-amino-4-hydroxy-6-hydroxymethyldihydropteridine diphosphokinase
MSSIAMIGLGSNLGDRRAMLDGALAALAEAPGVRVGRVSTYRETDPVGGPAGQGRYLNAAAALETTLDPFDLLRVLQAIEARFGRVRTVRWGERTLDLDLLLFGDRIIGTPELTVPHPRLAERRFVLEPLAEIAPDAVEPRTGRPVSDLLRALGSGGH